MDINIDQWLDVITNPLGLVGFVLFLVFSLLSLMVRKKAEYKKLVLIFGVIAGLALVGSMGLAYLQELKPEKESQTNIIQQVTEGENSPPLADVKGDVTIIIGKQEDDKDSLKNDLPREDKKHHAGKKTTEADSDSTSKPGMQIKQKTKGGGSPAVAGVDGDVNISINPGEKQ
jgi:hypothetical protein